MGFNLYGYVVMPNHFHALIRPDGNTTISDIMRNIKSYSAKLISEACSRKGSVWQSRFYDRLVRDERDFLAKLEYMHNNPVRAGLAENPHDYEFSSYTCYSSESEGVDGLLEVDRLGS